MAKKMFHFIDVSFLKIQGANIRMDMVVSFCVKISEFEAIYR